MISIAATSTRSISVAKSNTANTTITMMITISVVSVGSASIRLVYATPGHCPSCGIRAGAGKQGPAKLPQRTLT